MTFLWSNEIYYGDWNELLLEIPVELAGKCWLFDMLPTD